MTNYHINYWVNSLGRCLPEVVLELSLNRLLGSVMTTVLLGLLLRLDGLSKLRRLLLEELDQPQIVTLVLQTNQLVLLL